MNEDPIDALVTDGDSPEDRAFRAIKLHKDGCAQCRGAVALHGMLCRRQGALCRIGARLWDVWLDALPGSVEQRTGRAVPTGVRKLPMWAIYLGKLNRPVAIFAKRADADEYATRFEGARIEPVSVAVLPPAVEHAGAEG